MIGTELGAFRILSRVGSGGMGEVWRARDTQLNRDVAIKVLPDLVAHDADRVARFTREAQSLAALNHPNIVGIHEIGRHDGRTFLVMELVDGRPLSAVIPSGGLPLEQSLHYGRQVASALAAAHGAGLVHRDIKPANVMVTESGAVKVLDFGLAKATVPLTGDGNSPTQTAGSAIVGTVGYMSPEQAQGKPVDARTDVFAFGVLLYELVTGRRAFERDSAVSTLAAILKDEPTPVRELATGIPAAVERLIARCLRKDPGQRYQHMGDVAILLEDIAADTVRPQPGMRGAEPRPAGARRSWRAPAAIAFATLLVGFGAAWLTFGRQAPDPGRVRRFEIPIKATPSELSLGQALAGPVLSPDGRMLAFVEGGVLRVRDLDRPLPRDLATDVEGPFWSPDSREIGYLSGRVVRRVPSVGGTPVAVAEVDFEGTLLGGSWSDDGRIIVSFAGRPIYSVPAQGGTLAPYVIPDTSKNEFDFHEPTFLPGGRGVLAVVHAVEGPHMRIVVLTGTERKFLLDDVAGDLRTPTYAPGGWIVYTRQKNEQALYAVPFSLDTLSVTGPPVHLVDHATTPTAAADGTLAHRSGTWAMPTDLVLVDRTGRTVASAGDPAAEIRAPVFSPTGGHVAFAAYETATSDIRVRDLERSTETRVTQPGLMNGNPAWSPDGKRLAYTVGTMLTNRVVIGQADGSGEARTIAECARPCRALGWSADGSIVSWVSDGDFHWLRLDGPPSPVRVRTQEIEEAAQLSPDLKYYVYAANVSGRTEVYVRGFPTGEPRWQVSAEGGSLPAWSRGTREIYFVRGNGLYAVPVEEGASFRAGLPAKLFDGDERGVQLFRFARATSGYHPAPDGQGFVVARQAGASGNFITVVENWLSDLSARR